MRGYLEQATILSPEALAHESIQRTLVRCWELSAVDRPDGAERLPGPPQLSVREYVLPGEPPTGLKLVIISGPAWSERPW
jgi:hypothetical protein